MSRKLPTTPVTVTIDKLVHGGQGIGRADTGKTVFVWNALPGETVQARIIKRKKTYDEAIAEVIEKPSADRIEPQEDNYLATSPWQMMTYAAENAAKRAIVAELFQQAHIPVPAFELHAPETEWHYRNKMEYSFWGDDDGLHLALHRRGSHGKQIVQGSALALPAVDAAANAVLAELRKLDVRAGDLKTVIVRASRRGPVAATLFVKPTEFPHMTLPPSLQELRVYHSDPRSPASVATKRLQQTGELYLHDGLLDTEFIYDADSFFQVNLPIFEQALQTIRDHCSGDPVDLYAGVGSIGLSVAKRAVTLVELDPATVAMARLNFEASNLRGEVIAASTEKVLEYIMADKPVIVDPPRAGLHGKVIERLLETRPLQLIYLSCSPATQARDLALLNEAYRIDHFAAYNFFPRTPHIETLAVLTPR